MPTHLALLVLLLALPATAILIDSGDGTGNTSTPAPDPGWNNVGLVGSLTAVYVGNSYVLTANHVGAGDVTLDGSVYQAVPGTEERLDTAPGTNNADLLLFSIHPIPPLPSLAISSVSPAVGEDVILIGNGRDRGAVIDPNGPLPPPPIGYEWAASRTLRWGTNQIDSFETLVIGASTTESLNTSFDAGATPHEGTAATGDSGGALFHDTGTQWELAGILLAVSQFQGQDPSSSIYGNLTHAADLSVYRQQILDTVAIPEPAGGLPCGIAALLGLGRRRRRRA